MKRQFLIFALLAVVGCSDDDDSTPATGVDSGVAADTGDDDMSAADASADAMLSDLGADADITTDTGSSTDTGSTDMASEADTGQTNSGLLFRDEFEVDTEFATNAQDWNTLHTDRADQFASTGGTLEILPTQTGQNHWYQNAQGPYLYRLVEGDFVVETTVEVTSIDDQAVAPEPGFNSAGFVVRDPASMPMAENWVMYNLGAQSGQVPFGVEAKTTIDSSSNLQLFDVPSATLTYRLRVCRVDNSFRYFRASVGAEDWSETVPDTPHNRADFAAELQVGLVAGTWSGTPVRAAFERVVAWRPTAGCTAPEPQ